MQNLVYIMIDHHNFQHMPIKEQQQQIQQEPPNYDAPWPIKFMIGYLYFAQGFVLSIAGTVPYVYPQLPQYFTLSLFSLSVLPFSLKFITAPIVEKYSNLQYGKRKTWIIVSQIITNLMVFLCSFFTDQAYAGTFAILSIFMYLGLSLQDISLDALCLKQFKNAKLMSMIQSACQSSGAIFGGLILLKFTSQQFASKIGRDHPISTLQQLMIGLSIFLLVPGILIHFLFKQTREPAQERATKQSIWKVYSIYKYYFKKQYRYCRLIIFALIYFQGFNFFYSGYSYELIHKGFSRDTMNTIDNIQSAIIICLTFAIGTHVNILGFTKTIVITLGLLWIVSMYLWIWFPLGLLIVIIINFILTLLITWHGLVTSQLAAYFPETGVTGMLFTMNASANNLGKNTFIHTALLKTIPWKTLSMVGLAIQVPLIVLFVPKILDLIQKGQTKIQFQQNNQPPNAQNQLYNKQLNIQI